MAAAAPQVCRGMRRKAAEGIDLNGRWDPAGASSLSNASRDALKLGEDANLSAALAQLSQEGAISLPNVSTNAVEPENATVLLAAKAQDFAVAAAPADAAALLASARPDATSAERALGSPIAQKLSKWARAVKNATDPSQVDVPQWLSGQPAPSANTAANSSDGSGSSAMPLDSMGGIMKAMAAPRTLGGHPQTEVNAALAWIILGVAAATGIGALLPRVSGAFVWQEGRPQPWVFALLLSSYALLIPGIFEILFSFNISFNMLGFSLVLTMDNEGNAGAMTENMIGFVHILRISGASLGAVLVVFYAMVIPLFKVVLLCLGEYWRFSPDPYRASYARRCVLVVQVISKWACPDMFAYILILYLVRSLGEASSYITTSSKLDIGFLCFSIFCIGSTFSSLLIQTPPRSDEVQPKQAPWLIRLCGIRGACWATGGLVAVFAATFAFGLMSPIVAIRFDIDKMPAPDSLKPLLHGLGLEQSVHADVSVVRCLTALGQWIRHGEAACILAFVMLAVFVILLTGLSMCFILLAAAGLSPKRGMPGPAQVGGSSATLGSGPRMTKRRSTLELQSMSRTQSYPLKVAKVIRHICMLDVFVMAVLVLSLAAVVYRNMGLIVLVREGIVWLLAAELLHFITYQSVYAAVRYMEEAERELLGDQGS